MSKLFASKVRPKKDWVMMPWAFHRLLNWLDEGRSTDGQKYLEMRQRLVAYFDRKNCSNPDDLADETLNRIARRLEEEGAIDSETPVKYCYIVARFVFMEYLRRAQKESRTLDDMRRYPSAMSGGDEQRERKEKLLECLDRCLGELESSPRELILRYYVRKERVKIENRRLLAEALGITVNALTIRACRIRDKLEECVRRCNGGE
jgi:DNA-directed RNA polymerase specialized sigma24 family protein